MAAESWRLRSDPHTATAAVVSFVTSYKRLHIDLPALRFLCCPLQRWTRSSRYGPLGLGRKATSSMSTFVIDDAADILDWLDELQLYKRKAKLTQNIPAAAADGVIVAEIIYAVYPKIIQSRKENWRLLNRKVLRLLHCEVKEEDVDMFSNRRSPRGVLEYLRLLRAKLPAYEPFYLSGNYAGSVESGSTLRNTRTQQKEVAPLPREEASAPVATTAARRTTGTSQSMGAAVRRPSEMSMGSTASATNSLSPKKSAGGAMRRPSMMKSEQLLKQREEVTQRASRRASCMSSNEMDRMYTQLASKMRRSTQELSRKSDVMDERSAVMDAQLSALRQQNQEELQNIEKQIAKTRLTLAEVELGQEVIGVDDEVLDHLQQEQKSSNFKGQLTKQFHRASIVIGTPDSVWYQKDESRGTAAAGALATRSQSFSSSSVKTPIVKRAASSPADTSPSTGAYSATDGISPLTANTRYATTPPDSRLGSYAHTPLLEEDEIDESDDESDTPPPPPRPSTQSEARRMPTPLDDDPPPPPPLDDLPPVPVVSWLRGWSSEHNRHYYTRTVDCIVPGAERSQWTVPTAGIVRCKDDKTGKDYFTNVSTGKTSWILSEL